jgi:glycosyltransferase involved in cell wall biosynthesis
MATSTIGRVPENAQPRRIALVASSFAPHVGGVEEHVRHVARELMTAGHSVEIWTVDRGEHLGQRVVDGLTVQYLPSPLPARSMRALLSYAAHGPSAWMRWVGVQRAFRPDILHVQCFGPNGLYALALHRRFRTPLVVSSHGETFADDHAIFDESALLRAGLRGALVRATATTGCSRFVLNHLAGNFGLSGGVVVPNGVDQDVASCTRETWRAPYAFAVGRLGRQKGFDLLLSAYAASSLPRQGVRLIIGGDGPERTALEEQRRGLGLDLMVALPGRLSAEEVAGAMAGAVAVVVPSRVEAFGIVALEAWRSGSPLIMTSRGGGRELVRDGVDAILVDPTDRDALAGALDTLRADRALAARLSRAGSERVRGFTWAATAAAYDDVYSRAADVDP